MRQLIFVLLLIVACGLAVRAEEPSFTAVADPNPARFDVAIRAFEVWDRKNSVPPQAVLFVGSSSIRMWPSAGSFPDLPIVNRGFGGSHVSDVNHFAERIVLKYRPRLIVLYAGDNDVAAGKPPQQVVEDFQAFVELVDERLPETRIVYLPIKPSLARWNMWPQMRETNSLIERMSASDARLEYVDTATPMLGDDGRPRPELFIADGLHMNAEGYRVWNDIVRPAIAHTSVPADR